MKSIIDATAFIGDYPFRGFPQTSPEALKELAAKLGVGGTVVSSFHGLFWENNLEAALRTHEELKGDNFFHHFPVVNPTYPNQLKELPEILDKTGARGIRIAPTYHGYRLWDAHATELFAMAGERGIVVQILRMIQDERMHWLLKVPAVEITDIEWLLMSPPPGQVLLTGLTSFELHAIKDKLHTAPNVKADVSRVRAPTFGIEKLVEDLGSDQLVFGSLWPIQMVGPTLQQIELAKITDADRDKICGGNICAQLGF